MRVKLSLTIKVGRQMRVIRRGMLDLAERDGLLTGNQLRALKADDPKRWRKLVLAARNSFKPTVAAGYLGVSLATYYRWVKVAANG